MSLRIRVAAALAGLLLISSITAAQDQTVRTYSRSDFVNVDGGSLTEKMDRAIQQFKASKGGETLWLAYHFPARGNASIGPFGGMIYRDDDGIRLERHSSPDGAAVFLLTDVTASRPVVRRVKTLDINEPYLFENRPVYWLGNIDAGQSLSELESVMRADAEDKVVARGATRAIGEHDSQRVVPLLKELALKQTDIHLRRAAVSSLARVGSKDSLDALDELFAATSNLQLKQDIVRGYSYAGDRIAEKRVLDRLTTIAQSDPQIELRREALRRIASFKGDAVTDRLYQIYDQSSDRDTKLEILKRVAGGESGNDRSIKRLIAIAKSGNDVEFQRTAIRRLSADASEEQLKALMEIYDGATSDPVKEEVISRLGQSSNQKAKDKLVAIAKNDPSARLRQAAVRRLSGSRPFAVSVN
jgi:hypothetical protein